MLFFALLHSVDFYCLPCAFRVPCAVSPGYQQQSHRGNPNKKWRSCLPWGNFGSAGPVPPFPAIPSGPSLSTDVHGAGWQQSHFGWALSGRAFRRDSEVDSVNMKNLKSHAIAPCQPSVKLAQGLLFHFSKGGYSQALDAEDFVNAVVSVWYKN